MNRQQEILSVFAGDKVLILSKKEIIEKGEINYPFAHNIPKYVGETLTRMVKSNKIKRVGRGLYKLPSHTDLRPENTNIGMFNF